MNKGGTNIIKSYELALEAETIATVEENSSLIIDSKLAIIENLEFQNKLSTIPDKMQEVKELIESFDDFDNTKNQKLSNYNTIKTKYNSLIEQD